MAFRETKHSVLSHHVNLPCKLQKPSSRLLLQGLSFTYWPGSYGSGTFGERKREQRGRCSIQFGGAKGKSTLIFLLWSKSMIEMVMQASCTFSTQINFSIWFWKEEGQKGFMKECKEPGRKCNKKVRRREWNVGTASKSNVCNCQCNPCKITQQRWYVWNCVYETLDLFLLIYLLSKSAYRRVIWASSWLISHSDVISLLCASTRRQTWCLLSHISVFECWI